MSNYEASTGAVTLAWRAQPPASPSELSLAIKPPCRRSAQAIVANAARRRRPFDLG